MSDTMNIYPFLSTRATGLGSEFDYPQYFSLMMQYRARQHSIPVALYDKMFIRALRETRTADHTHALTFPRSENENPVSDNVQ